MKLKPVIASYSGESYRRIRQYLDDGVRYRAIKGPQQGAVRLPAEDVEWVRGGSGDRGKGHGRVRCGAGDAQMPAVGG